MQTIAGFALLTMLGSFAGLSSTAEAARFQQYRNAICPSASLCNIDFSNVPAGKVLDISNVSCYLRVAEPGSLALIYAMQLLQIGANNVTIGNAVTMQPLFLDSGTPTGQPFSLIFTSNDTISAFANAGQHFRAYALLGNGNGSISQFACSITGQITP